MESGSVVAYFHDVTCLNSRDGVFGPDFPTAITPGATRVRVVFHLQVGL